MAALFAVIIVIGNVALLGSIYWQMSHYLEHRVDKSIATMSGNFNDNDSKHVLKQVSDALTYDLRKSNILGLFRADGTVISGNLKVIPPDLIVDGDIHRFSYAGPNQGTDNIVALAANNGVARGLARRLSNGEMLIVGRDFTELAEIETIILKTLVVSGTVILTLGLSAGFSLSLRSLRRISAIRETSQRIVSGELSLRIPSSAHHDELDLLAVIVNMMLDEIERLLTEVKGVTDAIAHDLRTPLTRLRLILDRAQSDLPPHSPPFAMLDSAISETDALLGRFRALLRISEIENLKRNAGFGIADLGEIMLQVGELFEPLAEEKSVALIVQSESTSPVDADRELLFEALSNLLDNAIKFTPAGGKVTVTLSQTDSGPRIEIIDTGCGIDVDEREAVLQRYFRGHQHREIAGHGLGLSIVAAILHLHGFTLEFLDSGIGTHISILCIRSTILRDV